METGRRAPSIIIISLLPIREAYEWKPHAGLTGDSANYPLHLLPIREAYEWKLLTARKML